MSVRLAREASEAQREVLLASARILLGLVYDDDEADRIWGRIEMLDVLKIHGTEESSYYQAILHRGLAEGKADEARELLLRLGRKRFGDPEQQILDQIEAEMNLDRLTELFDRALRVSSWDELLAPADRAG